MLDLALIKEAAAFLDGRIRRTPVEPSPGLSAALGVPVWLKLESLQVTGSFKFRGALFRMSRLTSDERHAGVLTCSAGNHGKGVAYAARESGVYAKVCVPRSVDRSKLQAIAGLGADVCVSEFDGYDDTEEWAKQLAVAEHRPFLSAFDDYDVMASPALRLSLDAGRAITRLPAVETLAAGVEGGIGAVTFPVLAPLVDRVVLVTEAEILEGMRWMLANHQYLIEPTSAVAIAACFSGRIGPLNGPAVVVITGRNVSAETVRKILCAC